MRNTREIQTVSWVLDLLVMVELAQLGNVLMQRYKALEASVSDGGWHLARHYELIPPTIASTLTPSEQDAAARLALREAKLRGALEDAKRKAG